MYACAADVDGNAKTVMNAYECNHGLCRKFDMLTVTNFAPVTTSVQEADEFQDKDTCPCSYGIYGRVPRKQELAKW